MTLIHSDDEHSVEMSANLFPKLKLVTDNLNPLHLCMPVLSPQFTGQRSQIISHGHVPHLECSDCQYQALVTCVPLLTNHFSSMFTEFYIQNPDGF